LLKVSSGVRQAGDSFEQRGIGHSSIVQSAAPRFGPRDARNPPKSFNLRWNPRAGEDRLRNDSIAANRERGRRAEFFEIWVCIRRGKGYDFGMPPRSRIKKALCTP
jgi:hypothetical protein